MLINVFNVKKTPIITSTSIKTNYCIKSMHFSIKFVEKHTVEFFYYLWNVKVYEFVSIFIIVNNPSNWKLEK